MKFICISDTHNKHDDVLLSDADCLLFAGDITNLGTKPEIKDAENWLEKLPYEHKVVIAGNHDLCCDPNPKRLTWFVPEHKRDQLNTEGNYRIKHCTYLNQEVTEVGGFKIWGEPHQPEFGQWAFNIRRPQMKWQVWSKVPKDIDIIVTHGPPYMYGDLVDYRHVGCPAQLEMILDHPTLKLVVCGHIHTGYGITSLVKNNGDRCLLVNAALLNHDLTVKKPILVEFDGKDFDWVLQR